MTDGFDAKLLETLAQDRASSVFQVHQGDAGGSLFSLWDGGQSSTEGIIHSAVGRFSFQAYSGL